MLMFKYLKLKVNKLLFSYLLKRKRIFTIIIFHCNESYFLSMTMDMFVFGEFLINEYKY